MYTWAVACLGWFVQLRRDAVQSILVFVGCLHESACVCVKADVDVVGMRFCASGPLSASAALQRASFRLTWSALDLGAFHSLRLGLTFCFCTYVWCIKAGTMHAFAAAGCACRLHCSTQNAGRGCPYASLAASRLTWLG